MGGLPPQDLPPKRATYGLPGDLTSVAAAGFGDRLRGRSPTWTGSGLWTEPLILFRDCAGGASPLHQDLGPEYRVDQGRDLVHDRRWGPAGSRLGSPADAESLRYLFTVRRVSPVSFATSRRLIAPDSHSRRNCLNFSNRCGPKTTLPAAPSGQQQTS